MAQGWLIRLKSHIAGLILQTSNTAYLAAPYYWLVAGLETSITDSLCRVKKRPITGIIVPAAPPAANGRLACPLFVRACVHIHPTPAKPGTLPLAHQLSDLCPFVPPYMVDGF